MGTSPARAKRHGPLQEVVKNVLPKNIFPRGDLNQQSLLAGGNGDEEHLRAGEAPGSSQPCEKAQKIGRASPFFSPSPLRFPRLLAWGFLGLVWGLFFLNFFIPEVGEIILPGGCGVTEMLNSPLARGGFLSLTP